MHFQRQLGRVQGNDQPGQPVCKVRRSVSGRHIARALAWAPGALDGRTWSVPGEEVVPVPKQAAPAPVAVARGSDSALRVSCPGEKAGQQCGPVMAGKGGGCCIEHATHPAREWGL